MGQVLTKYGNQVIYPVNVDGELRSSVTLEFENGSWSTLRFGEPTFIHLLASGRDTLSKEPGAAKPKSSVFAVVVPALQKFFVARRSDEAAPGAPGAGRNLQIIRLGATTVAPGTNAQAVFDSLADQAKKLPLGPA